MLAEESYYIFIKNRVVIMYFIKPFCVLLALVVGGAD